MQPQPALACLRAAPAPDASARRPVVPLRPQCGTPVRLRRSNTPA